MSNLLPSCELPTAGATSSAAGPTRHAFYLARQGKPLFAWLHQAAPEQSLGHGVILCAPAGHEQVHTHRAFRHLAQRLADAGFSALRFDYLGAGDSADLEEGENTYQARL